MNDQAKEKTQEKTQEKTTSQNDEKKYKIMATSTMLTDLAKIIGGDKVEVKGLMAAGVDPHLYQPTAGDITKLQEADMVVINGLHLEGQMGEVFSRLESANKLVAEVGKSIPEDKLLSFDESPHDPHIWFSVANWKLAARNVTDTYIKLSEKDKQYFEDNYAKYVKELDELDAYIREQIALVPESARVLITAHDAFNYFGEEYGFDVRGLQGISTESEAAPSDVRELAGFIVENKIKAIFVESSVPKKTVEALQEAVKAKGFDVAIGGELYSDSLGTGAAETYIGMFKENIDVIVGALK
ncbi:manganese transporter [Clostridiales bacterium COT073_COT-073]|nr:manganese transporter [Clostridiales bacterium COT073_COT-073]